MSLNVSRTTDPLRFDTGIGQAGYAEVMDSPGAGQPQKALLPGSTTVTQALASIFPPDSKTYQGIRESKIKIEKKRDILNPKKNYAPSEGLHNSFFLLL